jgi:hypothetical protein
MRSIEALGLWLLRSFLKMIYCADRSCYDSHNILGLNLELKISQILVFS